MNLFNYSEAMVINALVIEAFMLLQLKTGYFFDALLLKIYGVNTCVVFYGRKNRLFKLFGVTIKISNKAHDSLIIRNDNKLLNDSHICDPCICHTDKF